MATSRILGLLAVATLLGVVPAGAQQVSTPANRNRKVITSEEIEQAQETNALQVVQKLRPEFLRRMSERHTLGTGGRAAGAGGRTYGAGAAGGAGGATEQAEPVYTQPDPQPTTAVFVDGTQMGGLEELQQIQASTVEEIRYLTGSDAETKYGPRFSAGVIEVTLKKH